MRIIFLFFTAVFLLFKTLPFAHAGTAIDGNEYVAKINAKLREISSARFEFQQTGAGKTEKGVIFYKKNYGLFMKYHTMPVTVLVNDGVTTYYDSKLEQKSQMPTQKSAAKIFTAPLEIGGDLFEIEKIEELPEAILIRATIKNLKNEGIFSMYFSKTDFVLRRIDIESPETHEKSRVDLHSYSFVKISNERFKTINIDKSF